MGKASFIRFGSAGTLALGNAGFHSVSAIGMSIALPCLVNEDCRPPDLLKPIRPMLSGSWSTALQRSGRDDPLWLAHPQLTPLRTVPATVPFEILLRATTYKESQWPTSHLRNSSPKWSTPENPKSSCR